MKLPAPASLCQWCQVDQPGTTLPLQINADIPCPIPDVVPDAALEILVYAGVFCGSTTPEGTGEYEIYVLQPDTGEKAAFYLSVNTGPASSYNNNSDNVWLPMPPDRTLHARLTCSAPGATALAGNLATELRVIAYRLPAGTPTVTVQPATITCDPGQGATFKAAVTGDGPFTYQWRKNGSPLAGETAATLTLASPATGDSGAYDVVVTAGSITITSKAATLTVQPVTVSVQTTATTCGPGQAATLTAAVVAVEPVTCQWQKDGVPLAGQTEDSLALANLQTTDSGAYAVVVTAGANLVTSEAVTLTVVDYAKQVMALNPLAYWPLNESAGPALADLSGHNLAGAALGTVAFAAGTIGAPDFIGFGSGQAAVALAATDTAIQVPPLNAQTNSAAIVGWINPDGIQIPGTALFFTRNSSNEKDTAGLAYSGGGRADSDLCFVWNCDHYQLASGLVPRLGQWNFVALVIEPQQATLYLGNTIDGLKSTPLSLALQPQAFADVSYLGWDPLQGQNRRFKGLLAQFAFFNQALTPAQMTALFNSARPPAAPAGEA